MRIVATSKDAGFTLIELMISAALMSIVLASSYVCLSAGVAGRRVIEARADGVQSGRTALNIIAADLRATVPLPGKVEFVGTRGSSGAIDADTVDFQTRNYTPRVSREGDSCEVSFFLTRDTEAEGSFILVRRRDATPDPEALDGGPREEIARGVTGLRFEYYDGYDWFDDWGDPEGKTRGMTVPPSNSYGLPEAVRVTITFDPERSSEPLMKEEEEKAAMSFQTIIRLDLATLYNRQAVSQQNGEPAEAPAQPAEEAPQ